MEKFYVKKIFELSKPVLFPCDSEFKDHVVQYTDEDIKETNGTIVEIADKEIDYLFELGETLTEECNRFTILIDDISFWIKFSNFKSDNSVHVSYGFDASTKIKGSFNVTKNQLFSINDLVNNDIKDTEFYDSFMLIATVFTDLIQTFNHDAIFIAIYNVLETMLTSSIDYLIEKIIVLEKDELKDPTIVDLRESKSEQIVIKLKDKEIIIRNNDLEEI